MTGVIQYILTSAQSFGSQDFFYKSVMTTLGLRLAGVLFCKMSRHGQNGVSYVPKKILTWMLWEAKGGLKGTESNRVTTSLLLYPPVFLFFFFCFFQPESRFP